MDCYLHEGVKILYRVSMAILQLFYKYSTTNNSIWAEEISKHGVDVALMNFCRQMPVRDDYYIVNTSNKTQAII